jgi:acetyl-CoA acetyltransferase
MAKGKTAKGDKPGGALCGVHPVEMLAQVLSALMDRNNIDPALVDDVITGCVSQVGEQSGPVGRWAWLAASLPETVPSVAIHRACGSSQQAADFAAQAVIAGACDIVVAAGVESMSRIPMFTARMGQDPYGPSVTTRYAPGLISQGVSAELIAARWKLERSAIDEFSALSHTRAAATDFTTEIVGISTPDGVVDRDETIRPATNVEGLGPAAVVVLLRGDGGTVPRDRAVERHRGQLLTVGRRRCGCADHGRRHRREIELVAARAFPFLRTGRR